MLEILQPARVFLAHLARKNKPRPSLRFDGAFSW